MQLPVEAILESSFRLEAVKVLTAQRLPLVAGSPVVEVPGIDVAGCKETTGTDCAAMASERAPEDAGATNSASINAANTSIVAHAFFSRFAVACKLSSSVET
jgi:hypothetical protein